MQGTKVRHQKESRLLSAAGLLQFLAMDRMGPLAETKSGNQRIIVLTDQCRKVDTAIPVTAVTSKKEETNLVDITVVLYGIAAYFLSIYDDGSSSEPVLQRLSAWELNSSSPLHITPS